MKLFKRLKPTFCAVPMISAILGGIVSNEAYAETKSVVVYTKFTTPKLLDIVKSKYPKSTLLDGKEKAILVKTEDDNVFILWNNYDDGSLNMVSMYRDSFPLAKINKWNKDKRFVTLYSDDDGHSVLNADLDVKAGVSEAAVLQFVSRMVAVDRHFNGAMSKD